MEITNITSGKETELAPMITISLREYEEMNTGLANKDKTIEQVTKGKTVILQPAHRVFGYPNLFKILNPTDFMKSIDQDSLAKNESIKRLQHSVSILSSELESIKEKWWYRLLHKY